MPIVVDRSLEPGLARISLARPQANILDLEMVTALRSAFAELAADAKIKAVVVDAEGPDFSFGASVAEHQSHLAERMLLHFHGLFRDLIGHGLPILAAVQGRVLGGGLELVAFANRVFAAPASLLAQPEMKLGVFAPVASLVLPRRIGQAQADDILLTGRQLRTAEALSIGLIDEVAAEPLAAAVSYYEDWFSDKSAFSLRSAQKAAHLLWDQSFLAALDALEALYLKDLMAGHDPKEGIAAFLEKRPPRFRDA